MGAEHPDDKQLLADAVKSGGQQFVDSDGRLSVLLHASELMNLKAIWKDRDDKSGD